MTKCHPAMTTKYTCRETADEESEIWLKSHTTVRSICDGKNWQIDGSWLSHAISGHYSNLIGKRCFLFVCLRFFFCFSSFVQRITDSYRRPLALYGRGDYTWLYTVKQGLCRNYKNFKCYYFFLKRDRHVVVQSKCIFFKNRFLKKQINNIYNRYFLSSCSLRYSPGIHNLEVGRRRGSRNLR